jgi:hypothetical protein
VELQQRDWPKDCGELRDALGTYEQRCQAKHEPIERSEIRGTVSAPIAYQHLVLEEQRFCRDGTDAAWAEKLRDSYDQVNREEKQVAHSAKATMAVLQRNTTIGRRLAL